MPPGTKKTANSGLGRALQKSKEAGRSSKNAFWNRHVVDPAEDPNRRLASVVEASSLEDFMEAAKLEERNFEANRLGEAQIVTCQPIVVSSTVRETSLVYDLSLPIPKRPHWTREMSKDELHAAERESFVKWRKELAQIEEERTDVAITPFERNIEVWKQLWRTIERSTTIVHILDARNPILYFSKDLVDYVRSFPDKKIALLLNKADCLTDVHRDIWGKYFSSIYDVDYRFFSASASEEDAVEALLSWLETFGGTVGMVGFPNVGKSSTINALCGCKRVGVAAQPGKTKHLQTLILNERITLCDCPGLVFPTACATKAMLVCGGVLPIDTIRDYQSPCHIVASRLPSVVFKQMYNLHVVQTEDGHEKEFMSGTELLQAYATLRGYINGRGLPDEPRAARYILKDYVAGKLADAHYPPIGPVPNSWMEEILRKNEQFRLAEGKEKRLLQQQQQQQQQQQEQEQEQERCHQEGDEDSNDDDNNNNEGGDDDDDDDDEGTGRRSASGSLRTLDASVQRGRSRDKEPSGPEPTSHIRSRKGLELRTAK